MRFVIEPSSDAPLGSGSRQDIAISPDGTQIVYNGRAPGGGSPQLNLRSLAESEGAPVRGSVRGYAPFLSPDGAWIGFVTQGPAATTLVKLSRLSGPWVELTESPSAIFGASWGPDDQIVFGTERSGLFRVSAVAATRRT
jgi:Tol biopolymer transport system component